MSSYTINIHGSQLSTIEIDITKYQLIIKFSFPGDTTQAFIERNKTLQVLLSMEISAQPDGERDIICDATKQSEAIINYLNEILKQKKYEGDFNKFLAEFKKNHSYYSVLSKKIFPKQLEVLSSTVKDNISYIINASDTYITAITLLRAAFCRNFSEERNKIKDFLSKQKVDDFLADLMLEAAEKIWPVCHGEAQLEDALVKAQVTLPDLDIQRNYIYDLCIDILKIKFNNLNDINLLYMIMGLLLFKTEGQIISSISNTIDVVKSALIDNPIPPLVVQIFEICVGQPEVLPLFGEAFVKMGILKFHAEPDIHRITALQQAFQSPLLAQYLTMLQTQKEKERADLQNPLLDALKIDSLEKVELALKNNADPDQYFSDGRTPLIFAIEECSASIINLLLDHVKDPNKKSKFGRSSPIYAAISKKNPNPAEVKALLEKGIDRFAVCGSVTLSIPSNISLLPQMLLMPPLVCALNTFKNDQTTDRLEVIKVLLQYGAGLGMPTFGADLSTLLDGIVVIGSEFVQVANVKPITNINQFKQQIKPEQYTFWKKVCDEFLRSEYHANKFEIIEKVRALRDFINKELNKLNNNNAADEVSSKFTGFTISASGDAKAILIKRVMTIIGAEQEGYKNFVTLLEQNAYSRALRTACTANSQITLSLVKILLEYKDKLAININEQPGEQKFSALHHAAKRGYLEIYNLLVGAGADTTIQDKDGKTPKDYLDEYLKAQPSKVNVIS